MKDKIDIAPKISLSTTQAEFFIRMLEDPDWAIAQLRAYKASERFKTYALSLNKVSPISFQDFWDLYDKKVGKDKAQKLWMALPERLKEQIMYVLPLYVKNTPQKKFRKNPATYLNSRAWEDELITDKQTNSNGTTQTPYSKEFGERIRRKISSKYN